MSRKLPKVKNTNTILIICEGDEEFDYLEKLKSLDIWSHDFSIKLEKAESIDNISPIYANRFQNGSFLLIVVFCDTEKAPYKQFEALKGSIDDFPWWANFG